MTPCAARMRYAATRSSNPSEIIFPLLISLDSGGGDDTLPPRQFAFDQVAEALRRAAHRRHALLLDRLANLRVAQGYIDLAVQLFDDFQRRVGGREGAVPGLDFEVGQTLFL